MQDKPVALTRRLAKFISETEREAIPASVYEHAKVAFMDWLSVTLVGKSDPLVEKLIWYADLMGGNKQATIIGYGTKRSVEQAALINGSASHALDFDDTSEAFLGHPSVTLIPSLLALAEWKGKSGADFLTAYIVGFKAGAVIGACAGLPHYMSGSHATATIGHFASAAACAKLLKLDEQETVYALGIAGTQAAGLKRVFGTMCKPFHAGKASQAGLMAALLAGAGFTSAEDILEGPLGFYQVLKGEVSEAVVDSLGVTWDIENLAQKYHASCHATHSPIEGILALVKENAIDPEKISSIKVLVSQLAIDAAGKTAPQTGLEGKFSIPYCMANALVRGDTAAHAFSDERVRDPEVTSLMKKIKMEVDGKLSSLVGAHVEVVTDKGERYEGSYDVLKDVPDIEGKKAKVGKKFVDLCQPLLGASKTDELKKAILSLEDIDSMGTIVGSI